VVNRCVWVANPIVGMERGTVADVAMDKRQILLSDVHHTSYSIISVASNDVFGVEEDNVAGSRRKKEVDEGSLVPVPSTVVVAFYADGVDTADLVQEDLDTVRSL
jgi:hypothetical protein